MLLDYKVLNKLRLGPQGRVHRQTLAAGKGREEKAIPCSARHPGSNGDAAVSLGKTMLKCCLEPDKACSDDLRTQGQEAAAGI